MGISSNIAIVYQNEIGLLKDLVKCKSIAPHDDGVFDIVSSKLLKMGFKVDLATWILKMKIKRK